MSGSRERWLVPGVHLTLVEHAFGERPFLYESSRLHPFDLVQLRGGPEHELWLKEALVNQGFASIKQRHPDARYFCWEDADVTHLHPAWAEETVHMLQHHRVGQTWTHAMDLDPSYNCATNEHGKDVDRSFCAAWLAGDVQLPADQRQSRALLTKADISDWRQHYGYSWAIRDDGLRGIGRLLDWMVTGSADYHMAMGFCGKMLSITAKELADDREKGLTDGYVRRLKEFGKRCDDHIRQDIGVVSGVITHHLAWQQKAAGLYRAQGHPDREPVRPGRRYRFRRARAADAMHRQQAAPRWHAPLLLLAQRRQHRRRIGGVDALVEHFSS